MLLLKLMTRTARHLALGVGQFFLTVTIGARLHLRCHLREVAGGVICFSIQNVDDLHGSVRCEALTPFLLLYAVGITSGVFAPLGHGYVAEDRTGYTRDSLVGPLRLRWFEDGQKRRFVPITPRDASSFRRSTLFIRECLVFSRVVESNRRVM